MFKKYLIFIIIIVIAFGAGYFLHSGIADRDTGLVQRQLQEKDSQLKELTSQSEKIKAELKIKDEQAAVKEIEVAQLQTLITANNKNLIDEQEKIKKASEEYEKEIAGINNPIDNFARCNRLCSTRASLGYPCKPNFCLQYK
ncbi:MAG TPA: hypothetical protein PLP33_14535 [Leptospiraceae bacterium]|nr:hypothetical protein [Leptospiraceae bacterium]